MTAQSQIAGFTSTNIVEVETNTKALRVTLRPEDYGTLGIYSLSAPSGLIGAGLTAAAPVYAWRWGDATRLALLKRVTFSAANDAIAFAAGSCVFNMFVARAWTVSDSAGTVITPATTGNRLRTTGMGPSLVTDVRISALVTLTAGTRTKDAQACGTLIGGVPVAAGTFLIAPTPIFQQVPGEHPLVFAQNEGFVIEATVPVTGNWKFAVKTDWVEIATY